MKTWTENYGADIDGNRGVPTLMWELEETPEERAEIAAIISEAGHMAFDKGKQTITYEDIEMEVFIEDYEEELQDLDNEWYKAQIVKTGFVDFEDITSIYKDDENHYMIKDKTLRQAYEDVTRNGFTAIPF